MPAASDQVYKSSLKVEGQEQERHSTGTRPLLTACRHCCLPLEPQLALHPPACAAHTITQERREKHLPGLQHEMF